MVCGEEGGAGGGEDEAGKEREGGGEGGGEESGWGREEENLKGGGDGRRGSFGYARGGWEGWWWDGFAVYVDHFGFRLDICSTLWSHISHAARGNSSPMNFMRWYGARFSELYPTNLS